MLFPLLSKLKEYAPNIKKNFSISIEGASQVGKEMTEDMQV
ncbi:hypothetical protein A2U01_0075706, partial [Trifolium medium]|nr:hypothetical protein [Trifolium medium]